MRMCQPHWDALKQAIKSRGLFDFVAKNGAEAAKQFADELEGKPKTVESFDPLMAAHNMIAANALETIQNIGADPMLLLAGVQGKPELECPICFLNYLSAEHDRACTDPNCKKPKGLTFDDWINRAADGAAETLKELKANL